MPCARKVTWTKIMPDGSRRSGVSPKYYAEYKDHIGKVRRVPGFTNKALTERLAFKLQQEADEVRAGLRPPPPPRARRRRGADPAAPAPALTIAALVGEFRAYLAGRDNTAEHVTQTVRRVERAFAGLTVPAQITADHVEAFLARLKAEKGRSLQTRKHYLVGVKQFTRWLVKKRKVLAACPLEDMDDLPRVRKADRVHVRRAEDADFLAEFVASVRRRGAERAGMPAESRVWLYLTAAATGLRAKELSVLTPLDFRLDDAVPCAVLPGRYTKNGEDAPQPIDPGIVPALRRFLAAVPPGRRVWPGPWRESRQGGKWLRWDLANARAEYLAAAATPEERAEREASYRFCYKDHRGRVLDFHALRTTYITMLARANNPPHDVQRLARHSDPRLTFNVYADHVMTDGARAVARTGLASALTSALVLQEPESATVIQQNDKAAIQQE